VGEPTARRTEVIAHAMLTELRARREYLDRAEDLASVSITVRLQDGAVQVRAVEYADQRIVGRRGLTGH
jgi:hypothetical protein